MYLRCPFFVFPCGSVSMPTDNSGGEHDVKGYAANHADDASEEEAAAPPTQRSCVSYACCRCCRALLLDVIYNNTRSKISVCAMFVLMASVLSYYFVTQVLLNIKDPSASIEWLSRPPAESFFGFPIKPIRVRVTDEYGRSMRGVRTTAKLFPKQMYQIKADTMNHDGSDNDAAEVVRGRSIDCATYLMYPLLSLTPIDDAITCNPIGWQIQNSQQQQFNSSIASDAAPPPDLASGFTATTDSDGIATFDHLTLFTGIPVAYAVYISHDLPSHRIGRNVRHVDGATVFSGFVERIGITLPIPPVVKMKEKFELTATVQFSIIDNRNTSVLGGGRKASNNESVLLQGLAVSRSSPTMRSAQEIRDAISGLVGIVMASPFDELLGSQKENSAIIAGNLAQARVIDAVWREGEEESQQVSRHIITAEVHFSFVQILATVFSQQFLVFSIAGASAIIPTSSTRTFHYRSPSIIPTPVTVVSSVSSITIVQVTGLRLPEDDDPSLPYNTNETHEVTPQSSVFRVREGSAFSVKFLVLDADGVGVPGHRCFVFAGPAAAAAQQLGDVSSKSLAGMISTETDAEGAAEFSRVTFSSVGFVGQYFLGVRSNEDGSFSDATTSDPLFIVVDTSLDITKVTPYMSLPFHEAAGNVSEEVKEVVSVTVGEPWSIRPIARVITEGGAGVSGKVAEIVAVAGPGAVTLKLLPRVSGVDGYLGFDEVIVQSASEFGTYKFRLSIDGLLAPTEIPVNILPPKEANKLRAGSCAAFVLSFDEALGGASQRIGSFLSSVKLRAVDQQGAPSDPATTGVRVRVLSSGVRLVISSGMVSDQTEWLQPQEEGNDTSEFPYSLSDYAFWLVPDGSSVFRVLPVTLSVECTSNITDPLSPPREITRLVMIAFARLATAFVQHNFRDNSDGSYTAKLILVDIQVQADVQGITSFPVPVYISSVQQPKFVADYDSFFGSFEVFDQTFWLVDDTRTTGFAVVTLSIRPIHSGIAGHFSFRAVADGLTLSDVLAVNVVSPVARIDLVRSLAPANVLLVGVPFIVQPVVRVLDADGRPLQSVRVIAELSSFAINTSSISVSDEDFTWPVSNYRHFLDAALGTLGMDGPGIAASHPSDADGNAQFDGLGFLGASPNRQYRIRYTAVRVPSDVVGINNTMTTAVDDPAVLVSSANMESVTLIAAQSASNFAVPAVPLAQSVLVSAFLSGGRPYLAGVGKMMVMRLQGSVNVTLPNALAFPSIDLFVPSIGGMFNVTGITFSPDAPSGEYFLRLVLPGTASITFPVIRVTNAASKIIIVRKPLPIGIVGHSILASVLVTIADGTPLPNSAVVASLSAVDPASKGKQSLPPSTCANNACGKLDETTTRATTGTDGVASFAIVVQAARPGLYRLSFRVETTTASLIERVAGEAVKGSHGLLTGARDLRAAQSVMQLDQSMPSEVSGEASDAAGAAAPLAGILQGTLDDDAKNFAKSEVSSRLSGDEALSTLITSAVFQAVSAESSVTALTDVFTLANDVAQVLVDVQPVLGVNQDFLINAAGSVAFQQQPVVRVVDAAGRPLGRRTVHVSLIPATRDLSFDKISLTDEHGVCSFTELRMGKGDVGSFHFVFHVDGLSSLPTSSFTISALRISTESLMYVMSAGLVIVLLPAFFSVYPFSSGAWIFIAILTFSGFVVVLLIFEFAQELFFVTSSAYIVVQLVVMIGAFLVLVVATVVVAVVWIVESRSKKPLTRKRLDGQSRPAAWYAYTRWLILIRRPYKPQEEWEAIIQQEKLNSFAGRVATAFSRCCGGGSAAAAALKLKGEGGVAHDLYQGHFIPPEIPLPDGTPYPTEIPTKMWIALCISSVLIIACLTTTLWLLDIVGAQLKTFVFHFPAPPSGLSDSERGQFNSELQSSVVFGLNLMAQAVPAVSSLSQFEEAIRSFDLLSLWETIYSVLSDFQQSMYNNAFGATIAAFTVVAVTWVTLLMSTKGLMKSARRGALRELRAKAMLAEADRYIGLQCAHLLFSYFLVFGVFFTILMVVTSSYLVKRILDAVLGAILASLASTIATMLLEYLVVRTILTSGLIILCLHPYSWWTLGAVLVSVLNGLIQTAVRLLQAIFSIVFLFSRLDLDIFPKELLFLDVGYRAFYAMLLADEEYNNPLFLTCAAVMVSESAMRSYVKENPEQKLPSTIAEIEAIIEQKVQLPQLRVLALLHLRDALRPSSSTKKSCVDVDDPIDEKKVAALCDCSEKTQRRRKIEYRWRLAALLSLNPSLCKLRMIDDDEVVDDIGDENGAEAAKTLQRTPIGQPCRNPLRGASTIDAGNAPNDDVTIQPPHGDWVRDEASGLYWSDEHGLFLDVFTDQFYDPGSEMWYDPTSDEWYDPRGCDD